MARKKKVRSNKSGAIVVSPSALSYSGPSVMPVPKGVPIPDDIVVQLNLIGTIASSVAGVISTVFDSYAQASASSGWSDYINLYGEFRVLSMDVLLLPWNRYNLPTTTVATPLYVVEDRQTATALASLTEVSGYQNIEAHMPSSLVRRVARMQGAGEADWIPTSSSPPSDDRFFVKLFSSGNTVSTTFYDYLNRIMVQFRTRK